MVRLVGFLKSYFAGAATPCRLRDDPRYRVGRITAEFPRPASGSRAISSACGSVLPRVGLSCDGEAASADCPSSVGEAEREAAIG